MWMEGYPQASHVRLPVCAQYALPNSFRIYLVIYFNRYLRGAERSALLLSSPQEPQRSPLAGFGPFRPRS